MDEVGRGPLAGPVVAAAVILPPGARLVGVDDSKRVPAARRAELAEQVLREAEGAAVTAVSARDIDRLNIRRATFLAMQRAIHDLGRLPVLVLVDGERLPDMAYPQEGVVGGDRKSLAIACASIVAKVWRDRHMVELDAAYPGYGFADHKGYATAEHLAALRRLGPCAVHRQSFAPVRRAGQGSLW